MARSHPTNRASMRHSRPNRVGSPACAQQVAEPLASTGLAGPAGAQRSEHLRTSLEKTQWGHQDVLLRRGRRRRWRSRRAISLKVRFTNRRVPVRSRYGIANGSHWKLLRRRTRYRRYGSGHRTRRGSASAQVCRQAVIRGSLTFETETFVVTALGRGVR